MNNRIDLFRSRHDGVTVPRIWVAIALSILMHVAALWELPPIPVQLPGLGEEPDKKPALSLRLIPPGPPPALLPPAPEPVPQQPQAKAAPPKAAPRQVPPAPPVITREKTAPDAPSVPAPKPAPSLAGDMASYIEAQRRARDIPAPAAPAAPESEEARRQRIIAGNLGSSREQAFGYDPSRGGGVFQIQSMSLDYAEFVFHGWNKDVGRNTKQLIEVRRGNNSDIRLAVVRRMISIIRDYEREDFVWHSHRLGRSITLSARARDNAGLEEFMMREFFFIDSPSRR
ncbi:MAG: hypothetical protein K2Y31_06745 [Burkholderiales bacterium]|jgi:hypothetical protein|nr:hypothetical protein [Burkholderiales bacterium]